MTEKPVLIPKPNEIFFKETVINKSRFLAYCKNVDDVSQATDFLAQIKKKHYDATHNCYAYVVGDFVKFSDDGEPGGTAGKPILNAIQQKGFIDTIVVVTRYFGGVKLGAGGLVRAYGGAANDILAVVPTCKEERAVDISVKISYANFSAVTNILSVKAVTVNNVFDTDVTVCATVKVEDLQQVLTAIRDAVNGQAVFSVGEEYNLRI